MDFTHYAEDAVALVNADLDSLDDARELLADRQWLAEQVTAADLRPLRRLQAELAAVFDASAAGDEPVVVERLNDLLLRHPVRPRISGHDHESWHLHVNYSDAPVAEVVAAESLYGMALVVTELGADRFGRCAATSCQRAYLDGSANRSKRFCSSRCASRTNVAAYRSRVNASTTG